MLWDWFSFIKRLKGSWWLLDLKELYCIQLWAQLEPGLESCVRQRCTALWGVLGDMALQETFLRCGRMIKEMVGNEICYFSWFLTCVKKKKNGLEQIILKYHKYQHMAFLLKYIFFHFIAKIIAVTICKVASNGLVDLKNNCLSHSVS